jgi:hypothetical protein
LLLILFKPRLYSDRNWCSRNRILFDDEQRTTNDSLKKEKVVKKRKYLYNITKVDNNSCCRKCERYALLFILIINIINAKNHIIKKCKVVFLLDTS